MDLPGLKDVTKALLRVRVQCTHESDRRPCRSTLAVVGPFGSGKSSLVSLIGGRLRKSAKVRGSLSINGKSIKETWVRPTFLSIADEPLSNVTVEQALVYTGSFCFNADQAQFLE